jgi:hypothetical protein
MRISVMRSWFLFFVAMALTGCGTPYGSAGSLGGVKVWEHPRDRVEIQIVGRHRTDYDRLAAMWKRKADEVASLRGASSYDILSFSTGREVLGIEVMGEGSNIERYSDDSVFWLPKVARGVIRLNDPEPPGASRRAYARQTPAGFEP